MRYALTARADRQYRKAPPEIQRAFDKQIDRLLEDPRHPSLRAKVYQEGRTERIWQARVNDDWRFYYEVADDLIVVESIIRHPK